MQGNLEISGGDNATQTELDAVADAQFIVAAADGDLTAERVATNTATIEWDFATAAQAKANVPNNAISDAILRDSAALSIIGRSVNSSGDPADIVAGANGQVLRRSADALAFAAVGLTTDVTGVLPITNGGTNASSFTNGQVVFFNGTSLVGDADLTFVTDTLTGTNLLGSTALIVGAATTAGVRLDLESGVLAVRKGDDSAYAALKALTLESTGASTVGGNLTVDTNTLFVDATNNRVGIGTTSPGAFSLDLLGGDLGTCRILAATTGRPYIAFSNATTGLLAEFLATNAKGFEINVDGGNVNGMVMLASGNVGLSTSSPDHTLDVRGEIAIFGSGATTGRERLRGFYTASPSDPPSDQSDMIQIDTGAATVRRFRYNDAGTMKVGDLAQV